MLIRSSLQDNVIVRPDGTCVLGVFSEEDAPSADTLDCFGAYLAPELINPPAYFIFAIDNYRSGEYAGEYRLESDIYALGCTAIEVRPIPLYPAPPHIVY